jgi:hypothetical protein
MQDGEALQRKYLRQIWKSPGAFLAAAISLRVVERLLRILEGKASANDRQIAGLRLLGTPPFYVSAPNVTWCGLAATS